MNLDLKLIKEMRGKALPPRRVREKKRTLAFFPAETEEEQRKGKWAGLEGVYLVPTVFP